MRQKIDQTTFYAQQPTNELGRSCVADLVAMSERLRRMFLVCGRWGTPQAREEAMHALLRLTAFQANLSGYMFWLSLRNVPATLCFYWYGIGALASSDFGTIQRMFATRTGGQPPRESLLDRLPPLKYESVEWNFLNTTTPYKLPVSQHFSSFISEEAGDIARSAEEGNTLFDDFETLIALESAHLRILQMSDDTVSWFWAPVGKFLYRRDGSSGLSEFESLVPESDYLAAGFFGGKPEAAKAAVVAVKDLIGKAGLGW